MSSSVRVRQCWGHSVFQTPALVQFNLGHSISCKIACVPSEDLDQSAHLQSGQSLQGSLWVAKDTKHHQVDIVCWVFPGCTCSLVGNPVSQLICWCESKAFIIIISVLYFHGGSCYSVINHDPSPCTRTSTRPISSCHICVFLCTLWYVYGLLSPCTIYLSTASDNDKSNRKNRKQDKWQGADKI